MDFGFKEVGEEEDLLDSVGLVKESAQIGAGEQAMAIGFSYLENLGNSLNDGWSNIWRIRESIKANKIKK